MQARKAWKDTKASKTDVSSGNFVKLEQLCEQSFTIVDAVFEPSNFNPEQEVVRVSITYDEDAGTEMEGFEFQFTTAQWRIMQRMRDLEPADLPVGPVTVIQVGKPNKFGTIMYDLDEPIAEIDAHKPTPAPVMRASERAMQESAKVRPTQSLRSKSVR